MGTFCQRPAALSGCTGREGKVGVRAAMGLAPHPFPALQAEAGGGYRVNGGYHAGRQQGMTPCPGPQQAASSMLGALVVVKDSLPGNGRQLNSSERA